MSSKDIVLAHAKDRGSDDTFRAAGEGVLDYDHLKAAAFDGPLILHGLTEAQVDAAVGFLRDRLRGNDGSSRTSAQ